MLIGTNDLAARLGIPGDFANPRIVQAYEAMTAAARAHGKFAGMGGIYEESLMSKYIAMGVRLVLTGSDLSFMMSAASQRVAALRALDVGGR